MRFIGFNGEGLSFSGLNNQSILIDEFIFLNISLFDDNLSFFKLRFSSFKLLDDSSNFCTFVLGGRKGSRLLFDWSN